jgi:hypothetical protein
MPTDRTEVVQRYRALAEPGERRPQTEGTTRPPPVVVTDVLDPDLAEVALAQGGGAPCALGGVRLIC